VPVDTPPGMVYDFRDRQICPARSYLDHGEALRAAGLPEQATPVRCRQETRAGCLHA